MVRKQSIQNTDKEDQTPNGQKKETRLPNLKLRQYKYNKKKKEGKYQKRKIRDRSFENGWDISPSTKGYTRHFRNISIVICIFDFKNINSVIR